MTNSRSSTANHEYATVDTPPDSEGYFTNEICPRTILGNGTSVKGQIFFSIRETEADSSAEPSDTANVEVLLEYKCSGDVDWTEFVPLDGSSIAVGNRLQIEDTGSGVLWRAGVSSVGYTSGAVTFGFDW